MLLVEVSVGAVFGSCGSELEECVDDVVVGWWAMFVAFVVGPAIMAILAIFGLLMR